MAKLIEVSRDEFYSKLAEYSTEHKVNYFIEKEKSDSGNNDYFHPIVEEEKFLPIAVRKFEYGTVTLAQIVGLKKMPSPALGHKYYIYDSIEKKPRKIRQRKNEVT